MADYIERQAAVSRFEQLKEQADTMRDKLYLDGVLAVIDALPAANVREDVRGEWVAKKVMIRTPAAKNYLCSVCKEEGFQTNFCPHCGARMDGGGKH